MDSRFPKDVPSASTTADSEDSTNIIDFAKARDARLEAFNVDAWLTRMGVDRASVEADFASLVVDEDDVPDLSHWKQSIEVILKTRPALLDQRMINESLLMERVAKDIIITVKAEYLILHVIGKMAVGPRR